MHIIFRYEKTFNKNPIQKNEIYKSLKYNNSLFTQEGIFFDIDIYKPFEYHLGKFKNKYYWYEIKTMAMPFDCKTKIKDILPDYYEATYQSGEWFINFLREKVVDGYEPCLLQRWLGDAEGKEIKTKAMKISDLKAENFEIPYDVLLKFKV